MLNPILIKLYILHLEDKAEEVLHLEDEVEEVFIQCWSTWLDRTDAVTSPGCLPKNFISINPSTS